MNLESQAGSEPEPDIYTTKRGWCRWDRPGGADGEGGRRRTEIQQADVAGGAGEEGAEQDNRQSAAPLAELCFHSRNKDRKRKKGKSRKAARRGSGTHDLTDSVTQRGGRELAARGGERGRAEVGGERRQK